MSFLKNIFGKQEEPVFGYKEFWDWFEANQQTFYDVVKSHDDVEVKFFNPLSEQLTKIRDGYFFLTGMASDDVAELILTAEGNLKNIAFVEELVAAAPVIEGWMFTALKPRHDIADVQIKMHDQIFSQEKLFFYSNDSQEHPDEIDITVIHKDYTEENKEAMMNGSYIFLDHYIGELNLVSSVDNISFGNESEAEQDLIPIHKLENFITWRQKEFIEKYEGTAYETENDEYVALEGTLANDQPLIAILNQRLLNWDKKASHPWMLFIDLEYKGSSNGMPEEAVYELLNTFEDELTAELIDKEGYLNLGRLTGGGSRAIYFACKDFRLPSKVLDRMSKKEWTGIEMEFDIYKDKYWRTMDRFV